MGHYTSSLEIQFVNESGNGISWRRVKFMYEGEGNVYFSFALVRGWERVDNFNEEEKVCVGRCAGGTSPTPSTVFRFQCTLFQS